MPSRVAGSRAERSRRRRPSAATASGGSRAGNRTASKERWIERVEEEWGEWGTIYYDDDGRVLGSMQYGPVRAVPARRRPAGGPAVATTRCSSRAPTSSATRRRWVQKSLFLAAIGEARDQGAKRARGVRVPLPRARDAGERFLVHRTVFPRDFLEEFGFATVRAAGPRRAVPARARRPRAGRGGPARARAARRAGGVHAGGVARAAGALTADAASAGRASLQRVKTR